MKIFGWMLSRRNGKDRSHKPDQASEFYNTMQQQQQQQPCKDEFSDWPNGLLAIGTFGNSNLKGTLPSNEDPTKNNNALEGYKEVLQNKCINLDDFSGESEKHVISMEKFFDNLQHEDEKKTCELMSNTLENSLVHSGAKDIKKNKKRSDIGKKSLSYLLKKALLCKGGFAPTPIVTDLLPDPKLDNSRMEKILRAMLHKKIYPQRPSPKSTSQKYLDKLEMDSDEEEHEGETSTKSKWVKTDSEYIVLEI